PPPRRQRPPRPRARPGSPEAGAPPSTSLLQEPRVGVRAVDGHVATGAVAVARLCVAARRDRVALVAELRNLLANEQMAVDAPVRLVAAPTPLVHEPDVLEDERPLEIPVTAEARPVVGRPEHADGPAAMRLVAVEAGHDPFVDLVVLGEREQGPDVAVATV